VAFKIIEPAVSLLKPPYTKVKLFPEMCCRWLTCFHSTPKPDEASLEVMDHCYLVHTVFEKIQQRIFCCCSCPYILNYNNWKMTALLFIL
jgi:hypothetical protein